MPVFEIVNTQRGIIYEPLDDKNDKYNIILTGYLKNGYKVYERKIMSLEYTLDEIGWYAKDKITIEGEDRELFERLLSMLDEKLSKNEKVVEHKGVAYQHTRIDMIEV